MEAKVVIPTTREPAPNVDTPIEVLYHVVLSVTDEGSPPLTRYRRVVLTVPTAGTPDAHKLGCDAPRVSQLSDAVADTPAVNTRTPVGMRR